MNSKRIKISPLKLIATALTSALLISSPSWSKSVNIGLEESPKALIDEVWQIVNYEYVDPSFNQQDWKKVRQELLSKNYNSRREAYDAIRSALKKLNDPYTRFLDPKQFESLTSQTSGELTGIGLRLEADRNMDLIKVVEPLEDSPAMVAGIESGDTILAIDGKSTRGMTVDQAANLIKGEIGTAVKLRLERAGKGEFTLDLTRAKIEVKTVFYSVKNEQDLKIGYIRLSEFSAHASEQMEKAIKELLKQNVNGFILDLRGNPGGLLHSSIEIARMWMPNGAIVKTVDRKGANDQYKANQTALTDLPLTVLVDQNSASASEILTGALQDNRRATVVGDQTFGKALVQSVHELSDGSGLAVTIAHYYTPNGTDISHKGLTPDFIVPISKKEIDKLISTPNLIGTPADPQYARAIAVLKEGKIAKPNNQTSTNRPLSVR